jgi:hypothetical protein
VESLTVEAADGLHIFSDGDLHLAARRSGDAWEVHVVRDDDGWTRVAGPIRDLAHLGEVTA